MNDFDPRAQLPFTRRTSNAQRKAREVARIAMLSDEGRLYVPACVDDLHELWEQAMLGESWRSAEHPTSDFRTCSMVIRDTTPVCRVVRRCMPADEMPPWLDRLIDLLSDERFAPACSAN